MHRHGDLFRPCGAVNSKRYNPHVLSLFSFIVDPPPPPVPVPRPAPAIHHDMPRPTSFAVATSVTDDDSDDSTCIIDLEATSMVVDALQLNNNSEEMRTTFACESTCKDCDKYLVSTGILGYGCEGRELLEVLSSENEDDDNDDNDDDEDMWLSDVASVDSAHWSNVSYLSDLCFPMDESQDSSPNEQPPLDDADPQDKTSHHPREQQGIGRAGATMANTNTTVAREAHPSPKPEGKMHSLSKGGATLVWSGSVWWVGDFPCVWTSLSTRQSSRWDHGIIPRILLMKPLCALFLLTLHDSVNQVSQQGTVVSNNISLQPDDVICGQSTNLSDYHPGNIRYRSTIARLQSAYQSNRRGSQQAEVVQEVLDVIFGTGGRFLIKVDKEKEPPTWDLAPQATYLEKIKKALRRK